ncbi:MAG: hypothetical protein M3345_01235 [Actinomycetota bacterium]|nr:hypothetical protein [Actinomycetota bacterium]
MIPLRKVRDLTLERAEGDESSDHISAASALVVVGRTLFVVADDERQLGIFPVSGDGHGHLVQILEGKAPADEAERTKHKPDLESLTLLPPFQNHPHGALLTMGSGTDEDRNHAALIPLGDDDLPSGASREIDLRPLYEALRRDIPELNIEGAAVTGEVLHLMQRGNNGTGRNARIDLDLASATAAFAAGEPPPATAVQNITFHDLGRLHGVNLCFSDAAPLPDGRIVFVCSAEDSDSHSDGPTVGSGIGVMDADGTIASVEPVELEVKLEGLEAEIDDREIRLLMVTDADDPGTPSPLLEARIPG